MEVEGAAVGVFGGLELALSALLRWEARWTKGPNVRRQGRWRWFLVSTATAAPNVVANSGAPGVRNDHKNSIRRWREAGS